MHPSCQWWRMCSFPLELLMFRFLLVAPVPLLVLVLVLVLVEVWSSEVWSSFDMLTVMMLQAAVGRL